MALTAKQERFVSEYLVDLNATQAAIRAGYSERTADRIGPELLGKTCVSKAIQAAIEERSKRTGITQEKVVEEIGKIAFATAADCADTELKYASKLRALELLGKHLGMFDGKGGKEQNKGNNLLAAIASSSGEDVDDDDLPEVQ